MVSKLVGVYFGILHGVWKSFFYYCILPEVFLAKDSHHICSWWFQFCFRFKISYSCSTYSVPSWSCCQLRFFQQKHILQAVSRQVISNTGSYCSSANDNCFGFAFPFFWWRYRTRTANIRVQQGACLVIGRQCLFLHRQNHGNGIIWFMCVEMMKHVNHHGDYLSGLFEMVLVRLKDIK